MATTTDEEIVFSLTSTQTASARPQALAGPRTDTEPTRRAGANVPLLWPLALILIVFLAVPVLALVIRTVERSAGLDAAARATLWEALRLTLTTSAISLALVIALGTPLAYLLARGRVPGRAMIETLVDLPMVLPPAVAGIALLMAFGRRGVVGAHLDAFGITVGFTGIAVVMAQAFVSAPFYIRAARSGFARVDRDVEEVAADLGAHPWAVFRTVTFPLIRPSLAAGAVLAWARAVGEFGATIMFAGNIQGRTQTMSLAIYSRYEAGDLNTALVLAVILLAVATLVLLAARLISRAPRPM